MLGTNIYKFRKSECKNLSERTLKYNKINKNTFLYIKKMVVFEYVF